MANSQQNNRQIAKNTIALYIRTFITMIIGLYTSRIMLEALGVDNYGINSVVGSIVAMSALITGAVNSSIARFITYALGNNDIHRMKVVFSTSINVMIAIAIIIVIGLEIVGVWFLNVKAVIPSGRMYAANWVLQFSIITLVINLLSTPFNATIVAHEHMSIYAYVGIVEVLLKLGVCYAIIMFKGDRLILFAMFNVIIALGLRLYYSWYCRRNFEESRYRRDLYDKVLLKEMSHFVGWSMTSQIVWVLNTQGVNMLINVYFGVVMNAARGIALTVTGSVISFVNNFTTAINPQITKSYASGNMDRLFMLIFQGTKFTWFLVILFIIPVFLEAPTLLNIWLGTPPEYSTIFLRFALFESGSIVISFALHQTILASGVIKRVLMRIALYQSLIFPLTWICFHLGVSAWYSCVIFIIMHTTSKGFTLIELKRLIEFPVWKFMSQCIARCFIVSAIAFILPGAVVYFMPLTIYRFFITIGVSIIWTIICAYYLGFNHNERLSVITLIKGGLQKFHVFNRSFL